MQSGPLCWHRAVTMRVCRLPNVFARFVYTLYTIKCILPESFGLLCVLHARACGLLSPQCIKRDMAVRVLLLLHSSARLLVCMRLPVGIMAWRQSPLLASSLLHVVPPELPFWFHPLFIFHITSHIHASTQLSM